MGPGCRQGAFRKGRQTSYLCRHRGRSLIEAERRNVGAEMGELIAGVGFPLTPVTAAAARRIADVYGRWGKGVHPAALNFGDCPS